MQVTEQAAIKIKEFLNKEDASKVFRIAVSTGGCNGFSYKTEISFPQQNDIVIEIPDTHGKVVTTLQSAEFLKNVILDYENTIGHSGFTFNNPDARNICGCGMSFDF